MSTLYILIILSPNLSFSGFWKSPSFSPPLVSVPFLVKLLSWFLCIFPISKCWSHLQDLVPSLSTPTGKESTCNPGNTGDMGLIPGSGRSPGRGNGNPPQYSCLENPMEWGAWQVIIQRVTKSRTWTRAWMDCPGNVYETCDIKNQMYSDDSHLMTSDKMSPRSSRLLLLTACSIALLGWQICVSNSVWNRTLNSWPLTPAH